MVINILMTQGFAIFSINFDFISNFSESYYLVPSLRIFMSQ